MSADFYAAGYRAGQIGFSAEQMLEQVRRELGRPLKALERCTLEDGRADGIAAALADNDREEPVVQVVNVRGLTGAARAGVVYCGRRCAGWAGHPLANPFKLGRDGDRDECIAKYRAWLLARPTLDADLAALWEQTRRGALPLGCWCAPELCHASVLAELLAERFGGEG